MVEKLCFIPVEVLKIGRGDKLVFDRHNTNILPYASKVLTINILNIILFVIKYNIIHLFIYSKKTFNKI